MAYEAKDYSKLIGMDGFSETLLKNHFTLYNGYVTNTNKAMARLAELDPSAYEYGEVKRRFGWEWNGMRLHELYFGNLGGSGSVDPGSQLGQALTASFGGAQAWEKDFRASGAMRGIGWVILYHDPAANRLINTWVNEHDVGNLAGASPLLVMDVFEHAFMVDYGLKKGDYIDAFFRNLDWSEVARRLG